MLTRVGTRYWAILGGGGLLLAGILASGVVAARFGSVEDPEKLASALREDPAVRVADIGAAQGLPGRGVFVQVTSTGLLCLFDAPSASAPGKQGGCNSSDDPLGGRELTVSFAYDGGPAPADVRDARLIGLASLDVSAVHVLMSDGTLRKLALRKVPAGAGEFRAFGHRVNKGDLRRSVTPTAVVALDGAGREIDRQATGFTG